ncbi:mitochondrial division protein 1 [Eremomyces bilateralis CBS 781.70]|uniref:Mitochondrial division protein 1 n=1 Tax=Eremomyces bilateralis CBS 781.70 TaxID=1392243 RepID=A0A6G1G7W0_9PEZI|nr:mitochondrial division protein 1 [Eremomyces bilateralis CBS 781.70]KAF1814123.1 mitochondrial division protein 1 [Eremomyces bilateralis CBS 781.70]
MAEPSRGRGSPPSRPLTPSDDDPLIPTRQIEAFGRKVTATAGHLIGGGPLGDGGVSQHYQHALGELHRELRKPALQRSIFNLAQTTPREIVRSKLSVPEIQHRALSYVSDELLSHIPEDHNSYSLFQGFQASIPEEEKSPHRKHGKRRDKGKLLEDGSSDESGRPRVAQLKHEKWSMTHRLEMMEVRKNMCSVEIREIDNKVTNLQAMRGIVLERLANLEQEEMELENDIATVDNKLEVAQELEDEEAAAVEKSPAAETDPGSPQDEFMSESLYQKLPSRPKRKRPNRRISMPILHEHLHPGSQIKEFQAHNDMITAIDFDYPFGTMVTAALDDTVRVWDLNAGRCMGFLEGHLSSVRCLQVDDNIVATGSMDATIRLWDLSKAEYSPLETDNDTVPVGEDDDDALGFSNEEDAPPPPPPTSMQECPLFSLEAHVAEITALHFKGNTLVSGSADKTLRQWDLEKGRCIQTLDVLWAAAQASATLNSNDGLWRQTGRLPDAQADFVGALQCFETALACGTADGMVRLWDLRSGQVHRSLVGHTGPVTALQFDDVHLVTGSLDRSIRIWDLRTGSIYDAFAYDHPITSMMFDTRKIVAAEGEDVVKVYDKVDGKHWDCGPGTVAEQGTTPTIEKVRIKDGYLIEGRKDGMVGIWSC